MKSLSVNAEEFVPTFTHANGTTTNQQSPNHSQPQSQQSSPNHHTPLPPPPPASYPNFSTFSPPYSMAPPLQSMNYMLDPTHQNYMVPSPHPYHSYIPPPPPHPPMHLPPHLYAPPHSFTYIPPIAPPFHNHVPRFPSNRAPNPRYGAPNRARVPRNPAPNTPNQKPSNRPQKTPRNDSEGSKGKVEVSVSQAKRNPMNPKASKSRDDESFALKSDDFPSLDTNTNKAAKNNETRTKSEEKSSFKLDERQLKFMKNVNFIKAQIDEHYKLENLNVNDNETRERDEMIAASGTETNSTKLSFKEALQKAPKQVSLSRAESQRSSGRTTPQTTNEILSEPSEEKTNKKKKKTKKKAKEGSAVYESQTNDEFEMKNDEFPGLSEIKSGDELRSKLKSLSLDFNERNAKKMSTMSDANSSDVEKKTRSASKSSLKAQSESSAPSSGKKSKQPMFLEFANMIDALEKGQQDEKKKMSKNNQMWSKGGKLISGVNPLDSNPSAKRGKEREKPKPKKPSTLKKIILKEREDKRLKRLIESQGTNLTEEVLNNPSTIEKMNKKSNHSTSCYSSTNEDDEQNLQDATSETGMSEDQGASNIMSPISQGSPISINGYTPYSSPYPALGPNETIAPEKLEQQVKQRIHSRKFREYCNQIVNKDIDGVCVSLLQEIVRFQDRYYHKNPVKAKAKRRYVMGIREVTKHLKLQKIKCVILAPNCEKIQAKGGLDEAINRIIQYCMEQNVPFVFALGRRGLGRAVNKLVPISVIGIFDYSGAEQFFKRLVELAENAKIAYNEMLDEYENDEREIINFKMRIPPSHYGHSRTPSNGSQISIEPHLINYVSHSRTPSGNIVISNIFNGHTGGGHSRSASGGGGATLNIDLSAGPLNSFTRHWTHQRTPSNCSNISIISRLSEPISEVGGPTIQTTIINFSTTANVSSATLSTVTAVQYYTEQVRNEMIENEIASGSKAAIEAGAKEPVEQDDAQSNAVQLSCIHEIDAGNEADVDEDETGAKRSKVLKKSSSRGSANKASAVQQKDETEKLNDDSRRSLSTVASVNGDLADEQDPAVENDEDADLEDCEKLIVVD